MQELIIVGAGPAGVTAAIYAVRKKIETLVLTKDFVGQVGDSSIVENYPGVETVRGPELMGRFKEQLEELGVSMVDDRAVSLIRKSSDGFVVETEEEEYESEAVIYSPGADPRTLDVPGEAAYLGKGVSYCVTCDGPLFADQEVAVIGGGNSGFEAALELSEYCKKITILERNEPRADEVLRDKVAADDKIGLVTYADTQRIEGEEMVTSLTYEKDGVEHKLEVTGIFIEIGYIPVSVPVRDLVEVDEWGQVVVDPYTGETAVPGFFGAGDVTDVPYKQIVIAASQGASAALTAYKYLRGIE